MSAEYPGATWAPIPGFGFPMGSHGGNTPLFIILHGTASGDGTAEQQVAFFQGDNQHGVHFVIGKDGAVYQMVQLADAAYGNCCIDVALHDAFWDTVLQRFSNLNTCTISIEHCKEAADNSDILTPAQQDASFKLVAWLCKTLNIPARPADASGGITGHYSINGINRANCPGPYPWSDLWAYLTPKGGRGQMLLQHPTDGARLDLVFLTPQGNVLHAQNHSDGMLGLVRAGESVAQDLGKPTEALLSVEAAWSNNGISLNVVAVGVSGQLYGKALDFGGVVEMDWTPIAGSVVSVPSAPSPQTSTEPLAQKIAAAVLNASDALIAGLK